MCLPREDPGDDRSRMDSEKAELVQEDQEVPRSVEAEVDQFRLEQHALTVEP